MPGSWPDPAWLDPFADITEVGWGGAGMLVIARKGANGTYAGQNAIYRITDLAEGAWIDPIGNDDDDPLAPLVRYRSFEFVEPWNLENDTADLGMAGVLFIDLPKLRKARPGLATIEVFCGGYQSGKFSKSDPSPGAGSFEIQLFRPQIAWRFPVWPESFDYKVAVHEDANGNDIPPKKIETLTSPPITLEHEGGGAPSDPQGLRAFVFNVRTGALLSTRTL